MKHILGISALYHDSAAVLLTDGDIVCGAQEERFTRVKHDAAFPEHAIRWCLESQGLQPGDLDYVCYYEKPLRTFDRLLETWLAYAPRGLRAFRHGLGAQLSDKLRLRRHVSRALGTRYRGPLVYAEHHESHAASAFYPSPFEEAAILTTDGVGEWATTTWGTGRGRELRLQKSISFPHSLGLLYSAFTTFCGFRVLSGEYKLMGLAPYGQPVYRDLILRELIDVKADGSYRLQVDRFTFPWADQMTGRRFAELFGGPARKPEAPITQREINLAASVQAVVEEVLLRIARHIHAQTGLPNLCLAGGVSLNCVANGRLLRESPFENIWIQPAAGDAGGALGAALLTWHQLMERPRTPLPTDSQKGSLLGPEYSDIEIGAALEAAGLVSTHLADEAELVGRTAELLDEGQVVGWFQGRLEYGPRALGSRSILGDPRRTDIQSTMNLKIKFRESFRPFAPVVLRERAHELFEVPEGLDSPYMLVVAAVQPALMRELSAEEEAAAADPDLRRRVAVARSTLPAVTHVDGSARIQTVDAARHGRFHALLAAFEARTGTPALVNTSFNVRGEPIVMTPADAIRCFIHTHMDVLVIGGYVVEKTAQAASIASIADVDRDAWLGRFELD